MHGWIIIIIQVNTLSVHAHTGSQCIEHSVQLVGDLSKRGGSPVICLGGSWNKVCYVNTEAAGVICRQLGFSTRGLRNLINAL